MLPGQTHLKADPQDINLFADLWKKVVPKQGSPGGAPRTRHQPLPPVGGSVRNRLQRKRVTIKIKETTPRD